MRKTCKVPKCNRPIYAQKMQLCKPHHSRFHAHGDVQAHIPIRKRRTLDEMQQRVIQKAPRRGSIPLSVIRKAVKGVKE